MNIALNQIRIASPCTASWDDMAGDERSRLCGQCQLHVYNLAAMSQAEAQRLIAEKEGRVCVRLYKRADGTVITRDCPVGLAALRRRAAWSMSKIAAGIVLLASGFAWAVDFANPYRDRGYLSSTEPLSALARWLREPEPQAQILMGDICPPPPTVAPALPPAGG